MPWPRDSLSTMAIAVSGAGGTMSEQTLPIELEEQELEQDDMPFLSLPKEPANMALFCMVPGRLSLLGGNKKIGVSLAEIKRRINPPECLNQSLLSAILRKAKNKDGGSKLVAQLNNFNIQIPQGRRKCAPNSSFTALCETEALQLAKDFHELSDGNFPFYSMAYEILYNTSSLSELQRKQATYTNAFCSILELISILHRDRSPVIDMPLDQGLQMHPESQHDFTNFSLLTHGFGAPGHSASWMTLLRIIKTVTDMFEAPLQFCRQINRPPPHWLA